MKLKTALKTILKEDVSFEEVYEELGNDNDLDSPQRGFSDGFEDESIPDKSSEEFK